MDEDLPVGWWAQRLEGARADAERITAELVARGHLPAEDAAALEAAVASAMRAGRELLTEALREPARLVAALRRGAATRSGADATAPARLAEDLRRLDERVARLERTLARMGIDAGSPDERD